MWKPALQHLGQAGAAQVPGWVFILLQGPQRSQQTLLEALAPWREPECCPGVCEHQVSGDSIEVQPRAFLELLQEPSDLDGEKTYIQLIFK